jgi:hypothetical protein
MHKLIAFLGVCAISPISGWSFLEWVSVLVLSGTAGMIRDQGDQAACMVHKEGWQSFVMTLNTYHQNYWNYRWKHLHFLTILDLTNKACIYEAIFFCTAKRKNPFYLKSTLNYVTACCLDPPPEYLIVFSNILECTPSLFCLLRSLYVV